MPTVIYWRDDDGVAPRVRSRMNAINVLCTACTTTRISECYVHEVTITFITPGTTCTLENCVVIVVLGMVKTVKCQRQADNTNTEPA
jgi:hypothetical protein